MKLSEAIRIGWERVDHQKNEGLYFHFDEYGDIKAACVLGCAFLGNGNDLPNDIARLDYIRNIESVVTPALRNQFPILEKYLYTNEYGSNVDIFQRLVHLNDEQWTIDDLIKLVEGYEAEHDQTHLLSS